MLADDLGTTLVRDRRTKLRRQADATRRARPARRTRRTRRRHRRTNVRGRTNG